MLQKKEENLIEVINQSANLGRLLDLLDWLIDSKEFKDYKVERWHPTTSSYKNKVHNSDDPQKDNDLILHDPINPNDAARKLYFEVSDVVNPRDRNGKEKKDLISLGILKPGKGRESFVSSWPEGRRFLVVSRDFARRLQGSTRFWVSEKHCYFQELSSGNHNTSIFEVLKGSGTAD